ncbi:MAG: hypothetical protein KC448_07615 [Yoonia sp.]|nr:hypothetical protein [Yoonia sp.]
MKLLRAVFATLMFAGPALAQTPTSDALPYEATYFPKACTAGDSSSNSFTNFTVIDPCTCADDTTTVEFDYAYSATAATRYDVRFGLVAAVGGTNYNVYQNCLSDILTGGSK